MKRLALIACMLAFLAEPSAAQFLQLALPDGAGAWTVHVRSSGGMLGTLYGEFMISSEGKIWCPVEAVCPKEFRPGDLQPLFENLRPDLVIVSVVPAVTLCSDCIQRTITISRRDSNGVVHTVSFSFDVTTQARLPEEVVKIYDAAVALLK